ncbi:L,D-transpeptidase family protein [Sphingomicrobium astaxanthinifaciens]|uniref:L,D-transpeptidase family protein n=1 Tax=Sphingomicrobium astaxanthinifaciens TaxID=1227949 RepID=UPI001FCB8C82|nr:L,D-transpeptidase family protein [Sphingomicrobium astaxanthinifaciens]MCJ7421819.1 L,D-transpeptidase family protein [Sphingomicrobium astaxanthinifaciens]
MRIAPSLPLLALLASAAPAAALDEVRSPVPTQPTEQLRAQPAASLAPDSALRWSGSEDHRLAAERLITLLRTADFEGYDEGPTIAAQAEALRARAEAGDAAAARQLSQLLDRAYLDYVTTLQAPVAGIEYGDPYQKPARFSRADHVTLLTQSPSLFALVRQQTGRNIVYEQLRAAAIAHGRALPEQSRTALKATLARTRALPRRDRFVLVDVATQRLWMYEGGRPVDSMKVVVGTEEPHKRTPLIVSTIHYATHNPYWHVPDTIVRATVGPKIRREGQAYLDRQGYEIVDRWANDARVLKPSEVDWSTALQPGNLKVRQLPGRYNSMGDFKFNFPNATGIYLHDTPMRDYFDKEVRTLSNGCIRLEDARRFAAWLYRGQGVPDLPGTETHDQLPAGVPVFVTYLTAEAIEGPLTIAHDVYGLDGTPQLTEQVAAATRQALADEAATF